MKKSMKQMTRIGTSVAALATLTAFAADLPADKIKETLIRETKAKLAPVAEALIKEHCGDDCPSFRIDPNVNSGSVPEAMEDLGFSRPSTNTGDIKLRSVSVTVLTQDGVAPQSLDSLKQILAYGLSNEVHVPVSVKIKALNAKSPFMAKKDEPMKAASPWFGILQQSIWPLALIMIAMVAFLGLWMALRNRRQLLKDQLAALEPKAQAKEESVVISLDEQAKIAEYSQSILATRSEDLAWMVEKLAAQKDVESLKKIAQAFSAESMAAKMTLSASTVSMLAELPATMSRTEDFAVMKVWLDSALDRARWNRIKEDKAPLSRLDRVSEGQLAQFFSQIGTPKERAAMIASVTPEKWPTLLAKLSSEERVKVGLALSAFQGMPTSEKKVLDATIAAQLDEASKGLLVKEGLVEDFSLYLSDKEGRTLWQELTNASHSHKVVSAENIFDQLDSKSTLEICMNMNLKSLKALLAHLPEQTSKRVITALPKSMTDRLQSTSASGDEVLLLQARAEFANIYRRFQSGSMMQ